MKLAYRLGTNTDIASLQQLGVLSYGTFKNILTEENWNTLNPFLATESSWSDLLKISTCFVCECSEEIVGRIAFWN